MEFSDLERYSLDELYSALVAIDQSKYPERHAKIVALIQAQQNGFESATARAEIEALPENSRDKNLGSEPQTQETISLKQILSGQKSKKKINRWIVNTKNRESCEHFVKQGTHLAILFAFLHVVLVYQRADLSTMDLATWAFVLVPSYLYLGLAFLIRKRILFAGLLGFLISITILVGDYLVAGYVNVIQLAAAFAFFETTRALIALKGYEVEDALKRL